MRQTEEKEAGKWNLKNERNVKQKTLQPNLEEYKQIYYVKGASRPNLS